MDENPPFRIYTASIVTHIFITLAMLLAGFIGGFMTPPFKMAYLTTFLSILVTSALIFMLLDMLKHCLDHYYAIKRVNQEKRVRTNAMIGFGGMFLCALAPKVLVFFIKDNFYLSYYSAYTFHISIYLFAGFFIKGAGNFIKSINYSTRIPQITGFSIAYLVVFLIFIKIGLVIDDPNRLTVFTFSVFAAAFLGSAMEFVMMCVTPFEMWDEREIIGRLQENENQNPPEVKANENDEMSLTEAIMYGYMLLVVFLVILGFVALHFTEIASPPTAAVIIISLIVIIGVLIVIRRRSEKAPMESDAYKLASYRTKMRMGYNGILFFGFVPRVVVYYAGLDLQLIYSTTFISLSTSVFFYYLFIHGPRKLCNFNYAKYQSSIISLTVFSVFVLLATIRIALSYQNLLQVEIIIFLQFGLSLLSWTSLIDLWVVGRDGVSLRKKNELAEAEVISVVVVDPEVPKIKKKFTAVVLCPVCRQAYSETKTPRILRECGHTMCEDCADFYLAEKNGVYLHCPSCRVATVVKGAASQMAKNYAVLELMEDVQE